MCDAFPTLMCDMWSTKLVAVRAARYLSWSTASSASSQPCAVAAAATGKASRSAVGRRPKDAPWVGGVEGTLEDPGVIDRTFLAG